ncbi:sigma factor-like helix-turn-helix DNA-binding protein [Lysinibacillus odysseyi]|uniref:sigma factor-like helix-turn-helix DNA-binding protein n=1 Tax=Lysinibacillus odysseyi TaxID=202611 RepID=UPI000ABEF80E|nr:sigma factor-like helix-turn-helix DNA-binding protein [Lysinibacillus odysseyi]
MPDPAKGIEAKLIASVEQTELTKHVMQLPVIYREVILLFYYEEYTSSDVAELLDLFENKA